MSEQSRTHRAGIRQSPRDLAAAAALVLLSNQLAGEIDAPFVNLGERLPAARHYRDFHHIRSRSLPNAAQLVADEITRALGLALEGDG